jgi:nucleoside-diphosphate-sugar epimerase
VRRSVSPRFAYSAGACLEAAYRCLHRSDEPPMTRFLASQLSTSHYYDVGKAQRDFGFRSVVSVDEGMQRMKPELERLAQEP